ncbi:MAG: hypothetical protein OXE80_04105 [Gammaproteobacteria bacterium]|nr:hypothetical protein [Gammaproteobacteria bacterium]MCY4269338.1 hypothetical protein [Gammaproteobacteria bacterium]MCY4295532.1 hypothetical protein [Gammaproteobacteria bacterium]
MNKLLALLQIFAAIALAAIAAAAIGNMVLMVNLPDTISVVNLLIGVIVIVPCLLAIARILLRRGLAALRGDKNGGGMQ